MSHDGGNITLNVPNFLTFKNNSYITATGGLSSGVRDGSNITIDAGFILAFPTALNWITANAFIGKGGNINIHTNSIFGESFFLSITASSNFGIDG